MAKNQTYWDVKRRRTKFELDFLQSISNKLRFKLQSRSVKESLFKSRFVRSDFCGFFIFFASGIKNRGGPGHRFHMAFRDQNRTREHGLFARVSCDHGKKSSSFKLGSAPLQCLTGPPPHQRPWPQSHLPGVTCRKQAANRTCLFLRPLPPKSTSATAPPSGVGPASKK